MNCFLKSEKIKIIKDMITSEMKYISNPEMVERINRYHELKKQVWNMWKVLKDIDETRVSFDDHDVNYNQDKIDSVVSLYTLELERLNEQIEKSHKEIEGIQEKCDHKWCNYGYDSHKDFYVCTKCGKEEMW